MLWMLLALHGQKSPGHRAHLPTVGAPPPVSPFRPRWEQFDKKYLSQLLMRKSAYRLRDEIWDVYYKLNIRDAISFVDQVGAHGGIWAGGWQCGGPHRVPVAVCSPPQAHPCPPQGGHVLSAAKLALPSMPSRTSMSESSVTNLL